MSLASDKEELRPHVLRAITELYPGWSARDLHADPYAQQRILELAEMYLRATKGPISNREESLALPGSPLAPFSLPLAPFSLPPTVGRGSKENVSHPLQFPNPYVPTGENGPVSPSPADVAVLLAQAQAGMERNQPVASPVQPSRAQSPMIVTTPPDLQAAGAIAPAPASLIQALAMGGLASVSQPNLGQQLGSALAGFGAGMLGQPNPVQAQLMQQQQLQSQQMRDRLAVAGVLQAAQRERRLARDARLDILKGLPTDNPISRTMRVKGISQLMKEEGLAVPALDDALIRGTMESGTIDKIVSGMLTGQAPDSLLRTFPELDPMTLQDMLRAFQQDPERFASGYGKTTLAQLRSQAAKNVLESQRIIRESQYPEIQDPTFRAFALPYHKETYKKEYWEGTDETRKTSREQAMTLMAQRETQKAESILSATLPMRVAAAMDLHVAKQDAKRTAPGSAQGAYFMKRYPYKLMAPETSEAEGMEASMAGLAAKLYQKNDRQSMVYVSQVHEGLNAYLDAILSAPDVFPPATGNPISDRIQAEIGWRKYQLLDKRTDPRVAGVQGVKRHLASLARLEGMGARISNFSMQLEQEATGFEGAGTREVKVALAEGMRKFINLQLQSLGFDPLPPYAKGEIIYNPKRGKFYRRDPQTNEFYEIER